jgi:MscS family membrane protein
MNAFWGHVMDFYHHSQNWGYVILILIGTFVVTLIIHVLLRKRYKRPSTHIHIWRNAIVGALNAPLQALVWIVGLSIAEEALTAGGTLEVLREVFVPARDVAAVATVAWFMLRFVARVEKNLGEVARSQDKELDETGADAIGKLVRALIVIIAMLVMMQVLGFSIASLLTFGGVAGIALGFAAQSLVANLLGGMTIFVTRIFKIGEDIILPGTEVAGTVQQIGWRASRVLGWNGKPFYVPNSLFNSKTVINHSRLVHRRISQYLLLRYSHYDKVQPIVRAGNEMLGKREDVGYYVFRFDSFGDAALKLFVYAYVQNVPPGDFVPYADFARAKEEILLAIADIARENGCELILPVSNIYMPEGLAVKQGGEDGNKPTPTEGM